MSLTARDLGWLRDVAIETAEVVSRYLKDARPRREGRKGAFSSEAASIVTEVDLHAEELIAMGLRESIARYDLGMLSEETPDDQSRFHKSHFWCVDPLDGTLPFVRTHDGFAASIALVDRDGTPVIGVVSDVMNARIYSAATGQGAFVGDTPLRIPQSSPSKRLSVAVDRSFYEAAPEVDSFAKWRAILEDVARDRGLEGVRYRVGAGAVLCACDGLLETPSLYFRLPKSDSSGGRLWDFAATSCLFREAGAFATDIYGKPLDLNRRDSTSMNKHGAIYASDGGLSRRMQDLCVANHE